jgi:hypothetical protein
MAETHCPICYTKLEVRDVAPCWDCGADPRELEDLRAGRHSCDELEALGARIVLCDFCQADFTSYDPTHFGQPAGRPLEIPRVLIRSVEVPSIQRDKVCPQCNRRLDFLRFVLQVRGATSA